MLTIVIISFARCIEVSISSILFLAALNQVGQNKLYLIETKLILPWAHKTKKVNQKQCIKKFPK